MNPYLSKSQYTKYDSYASFYRLVAREIVGRLPVSKELRGLIYDAGCGTGNSTLETLRQFPYTRVIGIDISESMLHYARIKFGFEDNSNLIRELFSEGMLDLVLFLHQFIQEAKPFNQRVEFLEADLLKFTGAPADVIVGSNVIHWLESQEAAAKNFAELLKSKGYIGLSSSANFYVLNNFTPEEAMYLNHPFVQHYLELLSRKIEQKAGHVVPTHKLREKKHPEETISLFNSNGFELIEYEEFQLPKVDNRLLLEYNLRVIPGILGMFGGLNLTEEVQAELILEAVTETFHVYADLLPPYGLPSDVNPIFIFRKK